MTSRAVPGRFAGRTGLVTGGSGAFGAAIARRFTAEGGTIAVLDVEKDSGETLVDELNAHAADGGSAIFRAVDVTDAETVREVVDDIVAATGRLDVAFNNAGIGGEMAPTADYPVETWRRVLAVNLDGVFHCMRAELPHMVAGGGGAIVNTASVLGSVAMSAIPAYVASKHAVVGLTRAAALEYGPQGVRVNAVGPSFTRVGYTAEALQDDGVWADLVAQHPLGRTGEPEDVAALALHLASDDATFLTGQLVVVDGGYAAR